MKMSDSVPTMKIWTGNGPVVINVSDFNPDIHTRIEGDDGPAGDPVEPQGGAPVDDDTGPAADQVEPQGGAPGSTDSDGNTSEPQTNGNQATAPAPLLVSKNGSKFFVVDQNGANVERDGIETKGYKTENDAWAAIMALNTAV